MYYRTSNYRCRFVLLIVWFNNLFVGVTVNANNNDNNIQDKYLYHTDEARGIIIDYEPPSTSTANGDTDPNLYRPDFIYGPNQGPRVVEFYAPWCPHVRVTRVCVVTNHFLLG
jgi:hypothetical protein